ncbi:MAG: hypothetical protein C5S41_11945 [Candidatus Methanomarinus sp.]|nr:MAG: hypothetical protein C5S41_11945 [ANME-2 cluster archaeon]
MVKWEYFKTAESRLQDGLIPKTIMRYSLNYLLERMKNYLIGFYFGNLGLKMMVIGKPVNKRIKYMTRSYYLVF